ncbi:MAG: hypothetical protein U5K74_11140 [Gemmatimonadaceae bacterium]|nr:hypothetical protein [Gemmatimonadaceae bacterium]
MCTAVAASPASAQRVAAPPRPSLVVFLTVDQMIPEYFARYGRQFTGGLRRLQAGGVLYTNGFRVAATADGAGSRRRCPDGFRCIRGSCGTTPA